MIKHIRNSNFTISPGNSIDIVENPGVKSFLKAMDFSHKSVLVCNFYSRAHQISVHLFSNKAFS